LPARFKFIPVGPETVISVNEYPQRNLSSKAGVNVIAPARLHMGFIDLNGQQERRFGSLGLGIEEMHVDVRVSPASSVTADGPSAARAMDYARHMLAEHRIDSGVHIEIATAIPEHAGLGSGTQLALAVGTAVAQLYGLETGPRQLAALLDRGNRSGIGIGSFMYGGFIVDAGRGLQTEVPPVISRLHFPDAWRLVLALDPANRGMSGAPENAAFDALPPMPASTAEHISWLVLMQILPALAEQDCAGFGTAISEIQAIIGDYFAPVQGGRFSSPRVAQAVAGLHAAGAAGIGQSSWGPTGFALFPSETQAHQAVRAVREQVDPADSVELLICRGRNQAAGIRHNGRDVGAQRRLRSL
jgi:beta-ribofuranosylaminobenzene 5'-phosphate synthase